MSTDGTSALGLSVSAGAVSVLVAERSAPSELAEKAVPALADGTSLSSVKSVRLLVALEVPPPDVSAFSVSSYIARSGWGTL